MTDTNGGNDRFIALGHSLLDHVATALAEQELSPEARARLEFIRPNLLPLGAFLAQRCGGDDDAYSAVYHLIEAVVTITDPESHIAGLGEVKISRSRKRGGETRGKQMEELAKGWEAHGKRVLAEKIHNLKFGKVADKRNKGKLPSTAEVHSDLFDQWDTIPHDDKVRLPSLRRAQKKLTAWKEAGLFTHPEKEDVN